MQRLPILCVIRHGETEWSRSHRHTGRTDIPLTERGEREARRVPAELERVLPGAEPELVLASPLQRAARTAELAGFGAGMQLEPDLMEWDYGDYEGITTDEIHEQAPGWQLFTDGCPNGEQPADVGTRAQRMVETVRAAGTDALVFSHGHFSRVLAACWLGLPPEYGRFLTLDTAAISLLGYEHNLSEPAILRWNDTHHLD
ncbi:MAG: histidine phosphatase family protein [Thiohalocapsa sp.]|jgi:probable phosphoglycerate mutase|uniref:histidine phosphatase family protein n=1 Tax=Thiohalocapsa sp. TaxID=2497641 RepID=UPI0025D0A3C5|nr:histidine phosphatase family protein [Thiohalocapsa sp.]MCG6941428.1 histidine phosphatase family protein [Thiohalocapsa sp.]